MCMATTVLVYVSVDSIDNTPGYYCFSFDSIDNMHGYYCVSLC